MMRVADESKQNGHNKDDSHMKSIIFAETFNFEFTKDFIDKLFEINELANAHSNPHDKVDNGY